MRCAADWPQRVRPLLNIGGLVKYPMGAGGVILNSFIPNRASPCRSTPRRSRPCPRPRCCEPARHLCRRPGAGRHEPEVPSLALGRAVQPVSDQGPRLVRRRPRPGPPADRPQDFCGVSYLIRDFRTSPAPSCVMLAGPGARGQLPAAVTGLKAGCKADVLLFLHTFNRTAECGAANGRRAAARCSSSTWSTTPAGRPPTCRCSTAKGPTTGSAKSRPD